MASLSPCSDGLLQPRPDLWDEAGVLGMGEAPLQEDQGHRPKTEVDSLLSHPRLPEVGQDPPLKDCVDLIGKHEKCGPLRNAWCKPEQTGGRPGLEGSGSHCLLHCQLREKLRSSGTLGLQGQGWAGSLGPGDRWKKGHNRTFCEFCY